MTKARLKAKHIAPAATADYFQGLRDALVVVEREPEFEGDPSPAVVAAMMTCSHAEIVRIGCRATKAAIATKIRNMLAGVAPDAEEIKS